ncbi:TIGR02587 family membrane protein [Rhizobium sp. G187]|uniref:TIGR02587 family membrane protein n=1 Tax=Rhizobium sp. G187 TaxID=3451352 RepID=UPI003EE60902
MTQNILRDQAACTDRFVKGLARGLAGALLFSLPMLMTMEMWHLGFSVERARLLLLLLINLPLLLLLSHRIGFERTSGWAESARDAIVAYAMGILASAFILIILGVMTPDMPPNQWIGMIGIQAVPASIGALLGRSQLSMSSDEDKEDEEQGNEEADRGTSYATELFMMAVGALFLSLNLAPTEEIMLIAYKMSHLHALALVVLSLSVMHGFVYSLAFRGGHSVEEGADRWHAFIRFTLPGYVVAFAVSYYSLWTFQGLDDLAAIEIVLAVIVLTFPAAIGAAAARLIL